MRTLLDECIDRRFASVLTDHFVRTAPQMGWAGLKNGELLSKAQFEFDAFITVDRNLTFQQHLEDFDVAVLVLSAKTNRLADLKPLAPQLLAALASAPKRQATLIT